MAGGGFVEADDRAEFLRQRIGAIGADEQKRDTAFSKRARHRPDRGAGNVDVENRAIKRAALRQFQPARQIERRADHSHSGFGKGVLQVESDHGIVLDDEHTRTGQGHGFSTSSH